MLPAGPSLPTQAVHDLLLVPAGVSAAPLVVLVQLTRHEIHLYYWGSAQRGRAPSSDPGWCFGPRRSPLPEWGLVKVSHDPPGRRLPVALCFLDDTLFVGSSGGCLDRVTECFGRGRQTLQACQPPLPRARAGFALIAHRPRLGYGEGKGRGLQFHSAVEAW